MKLMSIRLPDDLDARVRQAAAERQLTLQAYITRALEAFQAITALPYESAAEPPPNPIPQPIAQRPPTNMYEAARLAREAGK